MDLTELNSTGYFERGDGVMGNTKIYQLYRYSDAPNAMSDLRSYRSMAVECHWVHYNGSIGIMDCYRSWQDQADDLASRINNTRPTDLLIFVEWDDLGKKTAVKRFRNVQLQPKEGRVKFIAEETTPWLPIWALYPDPYLERSKEVN